MSHSTGLGSILSSMKLAPKSEDTSKAPISMPTQRRSPSITMSFTCPMRGGGGKHHCATLATLRRPGSSRQVSPRLSLMKTWAGSDPTQTTSQPCSRPARADQRSTRSIPSLIQFQVAPLSSLRATPTPWVAANKVPSLSAVTALTEHPARARCVIVQAPPVRSRSTTPSTVPMRIVSERCALRCWLVPPFDSKIIEPSPANVGCRTYGLWWAASSRSIAALALLLAGFLLALPALLLVGSFVLGLLDVSRCEPRS